MNRLIVSFTSYPARIHSVKTVLDSLYNQTLQADEIILWLAEEEFPEREAGLPDALLKDLTSKRFTLRWCDNLGSHKKYFYTMQEYPEDIIVTVDDDTFYDPDTLQTLMDAHARFPHAVAARTTSLILFDSKLDPLPISEWLFDFQAFTEPSMLLMAIGVGGVLYPPHSVNEMIFDKDFITETCSAKGRIFGDDLLLKVGEIINSTSVICVPSDPYCKLPNTQETALAAIMPAEKHKDCLIEKYRARFQGAIGRDSSGRLRRTVSEFEELDASLGFRKTYWLTRPSRDLERQLGYLSLFDTPCMPNESDYKKVKEIASFATRVFTAYPSHNPGDETAEAISALRQQLLDVPGIADYLNSDAVLLGITKYGVPLNTACNIIYHGIPIHMRSLKNWQTFMAAHPDCEHILTKGYKAFLKDAEAKMEYAESVLSESEIEEWKRAFDKAIAEYAEPVRNTEPSRGIINRIRKAFKV